MGRILQTDKRYRILEKMPRVRDGQVIFRKKPGRAKFLIAVLDMEGDVHVVLYRISVVYSEGEPVMTMSFHDYRRK